MLTRHRLVIVLLAACSGAVRAQSPALAPGAAQPTQAAEAGDIVVTAPRLEGAVPTAIPAVIELDETAIESYGAGSIAELLGALAPQTGPGRGRGGGSGSGGSGGSIVLLNGQRISGFAEIRDLPPEAIRRVQVLPEEVALQYGFAPDQRVVNFILKDAFKSVTLAGELGAATAGNYVRNEQQASFVDIDKQGRLNLTVNRESNGRVLESERGIVQQPGAAANAGDFRTLRPSTQSWNLNGVYNRKLSERVGATVNTSYQHDRSASLLGLASPTATRALTRDSTTDALRGGVTLTGQGAWNWTATGTVEQSLTNARTDRASGLIDRARTRTNTATGIATVSGTIATLPAGSVRTTLRAGFATTRLNGTSLRGGVTAASRLARDEANGRVTLDVPIANRARDVLPFLGKLSVNANLSYRRLSDFGSLTSYGYGANWQPLDGLTLLASAIETKVEPGIGDLGNPLVVTPLVPVYDFRRGVTSLVSQTSGGNPGLIVETQRDAKFSASYQPPDLKGLTVGIDYFRNRSNNPVANFPTLTPAIEAAFAGRVTRDQAGVLTALDVGPVNYARTQSDVVRIGFTFQKEFGQPAGGERGLGGLGGRGGGGYGGPRASGGGLGRFGGGDGGRWTVALYDNIRFVDRIRIRPGVPVLDLLGGDAIGSNGGAPRHTVDLDAGWFNKGLGFRLNGSYASATSVTGTTTPSTLRFGSLATLNLNAFLNFDNRKQLVEAVPLLKGARLRLSVQNVGNAIREVRDGAGLVPLSYQPGFVDPRGRYVEIDFRKRF